MPPNSAKRKSTLATSTWHNFLRKHRSDGDMSALAEKWSRMTIAEKNTYKSIDEQPREDAHSEPPIFVKPFPGSADNDYPLAEEYLSDLPSTVGQCSKQWQQKYDRVIKPRTAIPPQISSYCVDVWGFGFCQQRLSAEEQLRLSQFKAKLKSWSRVYKMPQAAFDDDWGKLTLMYFGPGPDVAAGAAADLRGWALLMIFVEHKPVTELFYSQSVACPSVGDTISFAELDVVSIVKETTVARDMDEMLARGHGMIFRRIVYRQVKHFKK